MIEETLKKLGFSEKETSVYLTIIKRGKISPAEVAQMTGINRATVYAVADELKKRGIIAEDLGSPTRLLIAKDTNDLMLSVKREEHKIEEKKQLIQNAIQELASVSVLAGVLNPKIIYIQEDEIESYLRNHVRTWNTSTLNCNEQWWGYQDHTFVEQYERWIDWSWSKEIAPKELIVNLITNKSGVEQAMKRKQYERRRIKYWKANVVFTATTWICGNYLIMIVTNQSPNYLIEINDPILAHNTREVLKGIWYSIQ